MDGQISFFDIGVRDINAKPAIGAKVVFYYEGKSYPAVVRGHMGGDHFYIVFDDKRPCDDNPEISTSSGWHVSVRGYKKDWDYLKESEG